MPGAIQLKHLDLLTQRYCGAVIEVRITTEDKQLVQQIPNIGTNTHFHGVIRHCSGYPLLRRLELMWMIQDLLQSQSVVEECCREQKLGLACHLIQLLLL